MIDFEKYAHQGDNYKYVIEAFKKLKEKLEQFVSSEKRTVTVFLQGSYKNDTNIGKESDIDIVIYYPHVFYSNIKNREDEEILNANTNITSSDIQKYNDEFLSAQYSLGKFKSEVKYFLKKNTNYLISEGQKTIKCQIPNSDFNFDVICAFQYRLYKNFYDKNTNYLEGNTILDQYGNRIINFPKQSYNNSINKNKYHCNGKYKETVRIIKNIMNNEIDEKYWIPSFALECIIYNVSYKYFLNANKNERCREVISQAFNLVYNSWNDLLESNKLLFLKNIKGLMQENAITLIGKIAHLIVIDSKDYETYLEFKD